MVTGNIYVQLLKKRSGKLLLSKKHWAIPEISQVISHIGIKESLASTPDPAPANNNMIHPLCAINYQS